MAVFHPYCILKSCEYTLSTPCKESQTWSFLKPVLNALNISLEEFPWKYKSLNIRHAVCKDCTAKRSRSWYSNNRESQTERVMENKRADRIRSREFVWEYLSTHPCIDCGETYIVVLEFDHVIGGKTKDVAVLIADGATVQRIKREIALCVVRCANCHRRKTAKDRG